MLITKIFYICNNNSDTTLLVSYLLSNFTKDNINYLFMQLEKYNIIGNKLHIIWQTECNKQYELLFTLDYSKFNDNYFMKKELLSLSLSSL